MNPLSHINENNQAGMVDVAGKSTTARTAIARCRVKLTDAIMRLLDKNDIHTPKGPVFHTAIIAGTMAAKKTAELIPLCHNIPLDKVSVNITIGEANSVIIQCEAKTEGKTGVEMEALTGASIAALTIYDMCKAMSHEIIIEDLRLIKKTGGKSDFKVAE